MKLERVCLPYGKGEMEVDVPKENLIAVVKPKRLPPLPDPHEAVKDALDAPIGCAPLSELVKPGNRVVIAVSCIARTGRYKKTILPIVIEKLQKKGVKDEDIMIIDAVGSLKPDTYEEWIEMLGKEIVEKFKVINHDFYDRKNFVYLGETEYGDPVSINRYVAEADLVICIDKIEVSSAGYTGGSKMIAVGCASPEQINATHISSVIFHPDSLFSKYKGNVFRDHLDAIGRKAEQESKSEKFFIINSLQNLEDEMAGIFAGDMTEAWLEGCKLAENMFRVPVPKVADILLAGARYPFNSSVYASIMTLSLMNITYPVPIAREGGAAVFPAILDSVPEEGTREYKYLQIMRNAYDYKELLKFSEEKDRIKNMAYRSGQILNYLRENIFLVGPKQPGLVRDVHCTPVRTAEKALKMAFERCGKDAGVVVIPDFCYTVNPEVKRS